MEDLSISRSSAGNSENSPLPSASAVSISGSRCYHAAAPQRPALLLTACSHSTKSKRQPQWIRASENNSSTLKGGCGGGGGGAKCRRQQPRRSDTSRRGGGTPNGCGEAAASAAEETAAVDLMACCVHNTVEQAKRMHARGVDCGRDDPYAALDANTLGRLLGASGGGRRTTKQRRRSTAAAGSGKKPTKWCKHKQDECDIAQLQLCPRLGEGHTHEKLIEEVTPVLMRAAQSLNCQLKEVCRRLFFMQHNIPQMTAPALVNFHAILAEINRMLLADFASFPAGLKLPSKG